MGPFVGCNVGFVGDNVGKNVGAWVNESGISLQLPRQSNKCASSVIARAISQLVD